MTAKNPRLLLPELPVLRGLVIRGPRAQGIRPPPSPLMQSVRVGAYFQRGDPQLSLGFLMVCILISQNVLRKNTKSHRHAPLCSAVLHPSLKAGSPPPPSQPRGRPYIQSGSLLSSQVTAGSPPCL